MNRKALALLCALVVPAFAAADLQYTVTDIGTFLPRDMNSKGQVVGQTWASPGRAVLWTPASPNGLTGSLTFPVGSAGADSTANGINDLGQVVGYYNDTDAFMNVGFLWTPDTANAITGTNTLINNFTPDDINSMGQIASSLSSRFWTPDEPNGTVGTFTFVALIADYGAINDSGLLAGGFGVDQGDFSFIYSASIWAPTTANGTSGDSHFIVDTSVHSFGYDINNGGQIAGEYDTGNLQGTIHIEHAFRWTPSVPNGITGTFVDVDSNASRRSIGWGIAADGTVLGGMSTTPGSWRAFVTRNGDMVDLNQYLPANSGIVLDVALRMNAKGQILCGGTLGGNRHAFLLTPQIAQGEVRDIKQQIQTLVGLGAILPANGQSLYAKLDAAIAKLNNGDISGAISDLQAFINQVKSFIKTKKISQANGQALIDAANAIINELKS